MKGSALVEMMAPAALPVLRADVRVDAGPGARPVRRPGGDGRVPRRDDAFDQSIADFSERYADQNEQDYQPFVEAIRSGRLEATEGV